MEFSCKINVVDAMMGSGKTSAAINYINQAPRKERIMFITPYLSEVDRIRESCAKRKFQAPKAIGTKLRGIKRLINSGRNIVSTHALFKTFDDEIIDMLRVRNYTLIIDEVADVVGQHDLCETDLHMLMRECVDVEPGTGLMRWRENQDDYNGRFTAEKNLCHFECLYEYLHGAVMWMLPIEIFNAFKKIYILTYMFDAQIQKYYYDSYGIKYNYIYVDGDCPENYHFIDTPSSSTKPNLNYKKLIHILEDDRMNAIGMRKYDLSKSWYIRNANNVVMKQLQNNISNYFKNIAKSKSEDNIWTTFIAFRKNLSAGGYTKAFISLNTRASNRYRNRTVIVYPVNRYVNTGIRAFFAQRGITMDEDRYALSEMLQFIWRSAIRDGREIWCYIPSRRMRELLQQWIEENSVESKN